MIKTEVNELAKRIYTGRSFGRNSDDAVMEDSVFFAVGSRGVKRTLGLGEKLAYRTRTYHRLRESASD